VYLGAGGNELTLPADWQPAPNTSGMDGLSTALRPAELEIMRKTLDAGLRWRLGSRWSWDLGVQHQSKEGTRPFGAGVFTIHSSHFPAPVDFATDRLDMGLAFAGETAHWRLAYTGSEFDNAYEAVTWPNPFTAIPGTELLRASLEPDNTFHQFELAGAWIPAQRLQLSGTAALGRLEQDEPLLPPSINPNFGDVPLPRATADTRIDAGALNLAGKLDARLSPRLSLTARLRRDDRDNQTPVDLFTPIITDLVPRPPRPNRPYSFERDRASLALRYRARGAFRLQAGADFEDYERSLQPVQETEEQTYWGELGLNPGPLLDCAARGAIEHEAGPIAVGRRAGRAPADAQFHRRRERERLLFDLDFFPLAGLTLSASYQRSEDVTTVVPGLRDSAGRSSADAGWSVHGGLCACLSAATSTPVWRGPQAHALAWLGVTEDRFLVGGPALARISRASLELDLRRAVEQSRSGQRAALSP
jgi:MtrB/PioB family decaheme-associated outer membrane protein